jgi:hypothetical protein
VVSKPTGRVHNAKEFLAREYWRVFSYSTSATMSPKTRLTTSGTPVEATSLLLDRTERYTLKARLRMQSATKSEG